jgi:hypothetical protein
MTRVWSRLAGAAGLVLAAFPAAAADVIICNEKDTPIRYSVTHEFGPLPPLVAQWKTRGWYVANRGCQVVLEGSTRQEAFLSIQSMHSEKLLILNTYPIKEVNLLKDAISTGTEKFFCVQSENFERVTKTFDEQQNCPDGYYEQLFNLYVRVANPRTRFTINLD